ncbi:uncharacterized protein LOC125877524 [Solanum stenotomum]|uniref:uncharacterized protein LOC125877524 n=1 Tax=Solanum stenotomum TaxID=172797 RepID=UPI0020D06360|nr:uncharacterized protein LOC125877524 [Solanum stenotomum]
MKKLMWWCAWSTYGEEFNDQLTILGTVSEMAAKELIGYPPQKWCRAYFDTKCKNQMVDNNFTESFNKWILEARHKPIIKMLEEIRVKVMKLLKDREEECRNWRDQISPYAKDLLTDYREIAQGCEIHFNGDFGYEVHEGEDKHTVNLQLKRCTCRVWDLTGIPCSHAIKALIYQKKNPMSEVHWWYSKEAYMLVYMHKLQPVRGEKFWKVKPEHAMEPPEIHKMVGRPKLKRKREKDEARKREGAWSSSRKGLLMTCGYCCNRGHNIKTCPLVNEKIKNMGEGSSQKVQDVTLTTVHESQTSEQEQQFAQHSTIGDDEWEGEEEDEDEDGQPILRPKVVSEERTRLQQKKLQRRPIGTRKISFKGDEFGVVEPTNLPYSPKKVTWKGKAAMTSNQLVAEKEKKVGKLKTKKARLEKK